MKKIVLTTAALLTLLAVTGCASDSKDTGSSSSTEASSTAAAESSSNAATADITIADGSTKDSAPAEGTVYMRQLLTAPHGTKSFAVVNVTMNGDKILGVQFDEFQYVSPDDFTGVPNADGAFGENFPTDTVLASKRENDKAYSAMMADKGGATQNWSDSMDAIIDFAVGKTAGELEAAVADLDALGEDDSPADVVTGATFSDTSGYLQAIIDTANTGMISEGVKTTTEDFKEAQLLGAPHGDKSFSVTTVALDGDKLATVTVDEFQYVDPADFGGVPNSDTDFGADVQGGLVLSSKQANNEAYSAMMADKGGATNAYSDNMAAITEFALGKTVKELEDTVKELDGLGEDDSPADVVTGATFSDTSGYLQVIIDAMNAAK
ncbi:peptidoglycan-binding protein [Enterococcus sp. BWT-B8]|uniref:peptidoglycan-binding protein n=1 Tax=unclassified Enterococcus TaxID=2608891 RepID=UPI001E4F743F|nr:MULTISPECIES: peptidoglycan-binding protein [unclassified Enterococcus]MCB5951755.1 peptidoglycan-binding protein [Enterococcus sp. BWT-B8]MCB5953922.1 peptidoglycan-binding protein [Enterococcus sp. CWB-B31]